MLLSCSITERGVSSQELRVNESLFLWGKHWEKEGDMRGRYERDRGRYERERSALLRSAPLRPYNCNPHFFDASSSIMCHYYVPL